MFWRVVFLNRYARYDRVKSSYVFVLCALLMSARAPASPRGSREGGPIRSGASMQFRCKAEVGYEPQKLPCLGRTDPVLSDVSVKESRGGWSVELWLDGAQRWAI